jgi:hypothetical protein
MDSLVGAWILEDFSLTGEGTVVRPLGERPSGVLLYAADGWVGALRSNVNPYGTFRLDMDKRLDLGLRVPRPRTPADAADRSSTETR